MGKAKGQGHIVPIENNYAHLYLFLDLHVGPTSLFIAKQRHNEITAAKNS